MLFEKIHLEEDEDVLMVVRRHWFILAMRVLSVIISAIGPFIILFAASAVEATSAMIDPILSTYAREILFLSAAWLLINWMSIGYIVTDHYLDLWVVTSRRIISIDQKALFVRSVGSFRLERLQDINIEIPGFLATMFDYGVVEAETASEGGDEFRVHNLPDPRGIKSVILDAADQRMKHGSTIVE